MNARLFPENHSLVVGTVTTKDVWNQLDDLKTECDVFEWRVDSLLCFLSPEDMEAKSTSLPILLTVRGGKEGGCGDLDLEKRRKLYRSLLPKATYIDIEIACLESLADIVALAREAGTGVIASAHNFDGVFTFEEMKEKSQYARSLGADAVKFAYLASSEEDLTPGREALSSGKVGRPFIVMGMGKWGPESRLLFARCGSALTYGYLGNQPNAPGQLPAAEFKKQLSGEK